MISKCKIWLLSLTGHLSGAPEPPWLAAAVRDSVALGTLPLSVPRPWGTSVFGALSSTLVSTLVSQNFEQGLCAQPSRCPLGTSPGGGGANPQTKSSEGSPAPAPSCWLGQQQGRPRGHRSPRSLAAPPAPPPGKGLTCWCQTNQKGVRREGETSQPKAILTRTPPSTRHSPGLALPTSASCSPHQPTPPHMTLASTAK